METKDSNYEVDQFCKIFFFKKLPTILKAKKQKNKYISYIYLSYREIKTNKTHLNILN